MSKYSKLFLAMESDNEIADLEVEEIVETELEVERDAAEVEEIAEDAAELTAAIENAVEDAEKLEAIQEILEESVEEGEGIDETAAEIAEVAVESICARLGLEAKVIPAVESFGSKSSKLAATGIAIEGFQDTVKKIWESIKAAFRSLYQKVLELWARFFDGVESTKKFSKGVRAEVADKFKTAGLKAEKATFEAAGVARALSYNGEFKGLDIVVNHAALTAAAPDFVKNTSSLLNGLSAVFKAGNTEMSAWFKGKAFGMIKNLTAPISIAKAEGGDVVTIGPFVNGVVYTVTLNEAELKYTFESVADAKEASKEVNTLSEAEMKQWLDAADKLLASTDELKKTQAQLKGMLKAAEDIADTVVKAAGSFKEDQEAAKSEDFKKTVQQVRKIVAGLNAGTARILNTIPAGNSAAAKRSIEYVRGSLAQYKAEAKA